MGVNLRGILKVEPTPIQRFAGQVLVVDSYNILYQFLSSIRQADGSLLRDSQGRVTSHLNGLFYRTLSLMKSGLKLCFVFDGSPHRFKHNTIRERLAVKEKAAEEWKTALEEGDMEKAKSKAQQTSRLTPEMLSEAKHLLSLLGLPCVQAPSEGEAQASHMNLKGDAYAVVSQDFDSILFGARLVARNIAISGRRKLPDKRVWVNANPEVILAEESLKELGFTREQLVDAALLIGTDFNPGIRGIGPKTAVRLIKKHGNLENVLKEKDIDLPELEELRRIFLEPSVTDDYELRWGKIDSEGILSFLCEEHDFSRSRIERELERFDAEEGKRAQKTLESFFG